jgi:hypothetical protein
LTDFSSSPSFPPLLPRLPVKRFSFISVLHLLSFIKRLQWSASRNVAVQNHKTAWGKEWHLSQTLSWHLSLSSKEREKEEKEIETIVKRVKKGGTWNQRNEKE